MGGKPIKKIRFFLFVISMLAVWLLPTAWLPIPYAHAEQVPLPLQPLVDQAMPGTTIDIPPGLYTGPVIIDKPLTLKGNGKVQIQRAGEGPVLVIVANGVSLSGIEITDKTASPKESTVYVEGSDNELNHVQIHTRGIGIQLREAHRNRLEHIHVDSIADSEQNRANSGAKPEQKPESGRSSFFQKGNGIDLWGSHDNIIRFSTISGVQDGIYIESSESNHLEKNLVTRSRYGYHLMFTKNSRLIENEGEGNVVGAMVMQTEGTQVIGNHFTKQYENVNSQGILIYNVKNAVVKENHIEENRIGIRVEQASGNQIASNFVAHNFVGLQLIRTNDNLFRHNQLISNVIQAQNLQSGTNDIRENYWDDAKTLDFTGDGKSDLPYRIQPFFLAMVEAAPPFQLFFQSPGMMFLEGLAGHSGDTRQVSDNAPLIRPIHSSLPSGSERQGATGLAGIMMLLLSILIIYKLGVRRK